MRESGFDFGMCLHLERGKVYGAEWSFGYTDDGGSGIFSCTAGLCQSHMNSGACCAC